MLFRVVLGCVFALVGVGAVGNETEEILFTSPPAMSPTPDFNSEEGPYTGNIPRYIMPVKYRIKIKIDMRNWKYEGTTEIVVNVTESTDEIAIHAVGLNISSVSLHSRFFSPPILDVLEDRGEELIRIYTKYNIEPGLYLLSVGFAREFRSDRRGFYRMDWRDEEYRTNRMVGTQFSPFYARAAWPCFDEPRFKANFEFIVTHESIYEAVSCGALASRKVLRAGWVRSTFEWTPPMSTYYTALILTTYRYRESVTNRGIRTRVFGDSRELDASETQLQIVTKLVDWFENYTGVNYPLAKLDLMPLPEIFVAAMENWGVITGTKSIINYDPSKMSAIDGMYSRVVLAHEVAHLWFGDLVTADWWSNINVKESTVSWFMALATNEISDDFNFIDNYMIVHSLGRAVGKDATLASRPAYYNPNNQNEIMALFDTITYDRGGLLYKMVYFTIGPAAFRTAVQTYLSRHALGVATLQDFVQALREGAQSEGVDLDVGELINRYTFQRNLPMVTVRLANKTHAVVTQERFLYEGAAETDGSDSPYNYTWHIPFTYTTDTERNDQVVILTERENYVRLNSPATWIKANNDYRMYYITNYELIGWKKLYHLMIEDHTQLTTADRIQLIFDMVQLVRAERMDIRFPLQFMLYLRKEREYGPWKMASDWVLSILHSMSSAEKFAAKIFMRDLLDGVVREVSAMSTDYNLSLHDRLLRNLIIRLAGQMGHPSVNDLLVESENTSRAIEETEEEGTDPELEQMRVEWRAREDHDYWQGLFESLQETEEQDEIIRLLPLLANTGNTTAVKELLEATLNMSETVTAETVRIVAPLHPETMWEFLKTNFDAYNEKMANSPFQHGFLLQATIENLRRPEQFRDVQLFFNNHDPGNGMAGVMAGLENIQNNIRWGQTHRYNCRSYFYSYARRRAKRFDNNIDGAADVGDWT